MDDPMFSDFFDLPYIWCRTRAYFHFSWDLQIFMELHDHLHLRDEALFVILSWFPSGAFFGPFNQAHTFWYLDAIMLLLLGDASMMFGPDSIVDMDDWDCTFDDGWSNIVWFFLSTIHLMPYWGIFSFWFRFIDLHGVAWSSPLTKYTLRQWPICYLIMIP